MKWSQALIPTLREVPKDAEIPSHQLLVRAGLIRQLSGGVYTFLPLGLRVLRKIERIVREEMDSAGGLEVLMPTLHPREIWERTGRADALDEILFKIRDRSLRDFVLGPTHEEIVTSLIAAEIQSYKHLPKNIYQIQTKFRDEPRPRFGLIRVKEFVMKDAYSFDANDVGADRSYQTMYETYKRIFTRLGLVTTDVEAHSGAMGGSYSHEFMVISPAGEDHVARCDRCGYAANLEKAVSHVDGCTSEQPEQGSVKKFATPGVVTIENLTQAPYNIVATDQIKTMVYVIDEQLTLLLMRGDHQFNEAKLQGTTIRPASADEILKALGSKPGSLGAVNVSNLPIYADHSLRGRLSMVTGANEDGYHYRGVNIERDIHVTEWLDLRVVQSGDRCTRCDGQLRVDSAIEVGHVFKLGTKYSRSLDANFLDENGKIKPMIMGCYGIGISRCVAAVVEQCHDDKGICWPRAIAPYEVAILPLNVDHAESVRVATEIYNSLEQQGIDVIIDDRLDRPGVKFNDADLIGFPVRVTIGEKSLSKGLVEMKTRRDGIMSLIELDRAVDEIKNKLARQ